MHSSVNQESPTSKDGKEALLAVTTLVTEGRIPGQPDIGVCKVNKGFYEGPHCQLLKRADTEEHHCELNNPLCQNHLDRTETVTKLFKRNILFCVEVFLTCACKEIIGDLQDKFDQAFLLEQWQICVSIKKDQSRAPFNLTQLANAIRSQLYFSQITAWLVTQSQEKPEKRFITDKNLKYRFSTPDTASGNLEFILAPSKHEFPTVDLGNGDILTVSFLSAPRLSSVPNFSCVNCSFTNLAIQSTTAKEYNTENNKSVLDDRMHTSCTLKGKHRCEEVEENECCQNFCGKKRIRHKKYTDIHSEASTSKLKDNDPTKICEKAQSVDGILNRCEQARKISIENRNFTVGFVHELHDPIPSGSKCQETKRKISLDQKHFYKTACQDKPENKRRISLDYNHFTEFDDEFENTLHCKSSGSRCGEKQRKQPVTNNKNFRPEFLNEICDINCDTIPSKCGENKRKLSTENKNYTVGFVREIHNNNNNLEAGRDVWAQEQLDACHKNDFKKHKEDKGQILLAAIERSGKIYKESKSKQNSSAKKSECNNKNCDMSECDIFSNKEKKFNIYTDVYCDSQTPALRQATTKIRDISNVDKTKLLKKSGARQKLTFDTDEKTMTIDIPTPQITGGSYCEIPSTDDKEKFRKNLGNAANMVFHSRTGLPLTSSPAPVRKGKSRFDFDSTLNSISAIKNAFYSSSLSTDDESENESAIISPCSPDVLAALNRESVASVHKRKGRTSGLLGSFEESVLNGRLEPVSTVHGFTAELGASGPSGYVPKHIFAPVTVFFYTFNDNDKVSSPYLSHINLGKKGYQVPRTGTLQVTLFNPLGTVVKMFVVMYDLTEMPPNSQTFIRQRTLHMPTNCQDKDLPKWLRYLIHLRFMSSKSGKIYLHSDIRMIILHKCDLDTASAHSSDPSYDTRSFIQVPTPRFCSRK